MAQLPVNKINDTKLTKGNYCLYVGEVPNGASLGRPGHYFPGIVVRGEPGYFCTDWDWGTDGEIARQCAADFNREHGLTVEQVDEIVSSSMFAGPIKKAGRR